jgi:chloramphenicol-sensitive protein RarD
LRRFRPVNALTTGVLSAGHLYALLAYGAWGLLPIYWKFLGQSSPLEVLCHRIVWSLVFLSGLLWLQQRQAEIRSLLQNRRSLAFLLISATLLTGNWGLYIYGVNSDRVVETSLGYFINPLVSVLLGFVVLKERLRFGQKMAVALAAIAVGYFVWQFGAVPWIALGLAFTFAFYGLVRKVVAVAPMVGLAIETLLATPAALGMVTYWGAIGTGNFGRSMTLTALLIGAGVVTSMPLLWFNNAAKRLQLSTLGFFQYLAPSIQLMLGVFVYGEPFTPIHAVTFSLIWAALLLYSTTSLLQRHPSKR